MSKVYVTISIKQSPSAKANSRKKWVHHEMQMFTAVFKKSSPEPEKSYT